MTSLSEQHCSCLVPSMVWAGWEKVCCRIKQQMHFTNTSEAWRFGSVSPSDVKSPVTVSVCCSSNRQRVSFFPESSTDNTGDSFMTYTTKNQSAMIEMLEFSVESKWLSRLPKNNQTNRTKKQKTPLKTHTHTKPKKTTKPTKNTSHHLPSLVISVVFGRRLYVFIPVSKRKSDD